MGWLIVLGVLVLPLLLPLGINAAYNECGAFIWLYIGPFRHLLYPGKRIQKQENPTAKKKSDNFASKADKTGSTKGGRLNDFLPLVQIIIDALGDLRKKLRVKRLEMKLVLAGDDPCDLSINYGRSCAALGNLMPLLERIFIIKKRNIEIECDYTAEETLILARLDVNITVGRLLLLAMCHGIRVLHEYLKIQNKRKGGANT